jgi:hypothetical protein
MKGDDDVNRMVDFNYLFLIYAQGANGINYWNCLVIIIGSF